MNPILAAALEYVRRGWSVIPVKPGAKKPLVAWAEYSERRATEQEVEAWWRQYPDANVGIVTGRISNLVVVDVDTYRGGDPQKIFDDTPCGMVSQTGSGGFHLFYEYPDDVDNVGNQVRDDGIDVRRDGGYVVAAPSAHANGELYQWKLQGGLVPPPTWTYQRKVGLAHTNHGNSESWITELLASRMRRGEGRNNAVAKRAGYLASKSTPEDVAAGIIATWNNNNVDPLPAGELRHTVSSVYRTASKRLMATPARAIERIETEEKPPSVVDKRFPLLNLSGYMLKFGNEHVQWMVDDWFPDETIAFMVAPPGHYKTWLLLDLAVSISSGAPFLGQFPVRKTGPVIIIQQEDHHGQLVERLATIAYSRFNLGERASQDDSFEAELPPDMPIYFHPDRSLRFDNPEIVDAFSRQIAAIKPALVIIDPLYSVGGTDDYLAKTAENMFILKPLRDKYGCSFLVSHHAKKGATSGREGIWGSQFLNAFLETGWQIRSAEEPMAIKMNRHFKVKGAMPLVQLNFDINTQGAGAKYDVSVSAADQQGENDNESAILTAIGSKAGLRAADIAKQLNVHRSTISRALKKLEKKGKVRQTLDHSWELSAPHF